MTKLKNISIAFAKSILLTLGIVIAAILVTKLFSILVPLILKWSVIETYTLTDIAATTIHTTYPQIIILFISFTSMFYYTKKLKETKNENKKLIPSTFSSLKSKQNFS